MSAFSRTKGATAEREVCQILRAHGWPNAERTSNGRTQTACDIANGPEATLLEVRRRERLDVPGSMRELAAKAKPTELPVLVHRPSRCEWMATLPFSELLVLLALRERGT